jgi:adenylyltransferase/sulfurtransferase
VTEAIKIIIGGQPTLENKLLYIDLNELSFDKIQISRQKECPSCGIQRRKEEEELVVKQLIIEELCGRDNGKRTYTVTPSKLLSSPISLVRIASNAELSGYYIKTRGNLGITAISNKSAQLSVSFLSSGAATIVGAKDEQDAVSIYRSFTNGI